MAPHLQHETCFVNTTYIESSGIGIPTHMSKMPVKSIFGWKSPQRETDRQRETERRDRKTEREVRVKMRGWKKTAGKS